MIDCQENTSFNFPKSSFTMRESLQTFIFSMLLLGCNIAPAHARIPASAFRSGRLRSYNDTPIYNPGIHHSPSTDVLGNLENHGSSVQDAPKAPTLSSGRFKSSPQQYYDAPALEYFTKECMALPKLTLPQMLPSLDVLLSRGTSPSMPTNCIRNMPTSMTMTV